MQAKRPTPCTRAKWRLASVLFLSVSLGPCAWGQVAASVAAPASGIEAVEVQRLIKEGQHAQALKLIDESLSRNPKDPQMRFRRGVALSMLDRKSEALAVFQRLVDDHPDMPAPYNNIAVIYGAQGDYEKARSALERAIRTNPAYATAYQNLGDVYAQLASQAYTKALQLDKNDTSVQPKLSLLRELTSPPGVGGGSTTMASVKPASAPSSANPQPAAASSTVASAVKPASTPAVPKPPAPSPLPAPSPAPVANNNAAEVEHAVRAWASAWSRRDVSAYVAAYAGDFTGQAGSHKAWEQERGVRIAGKKSISVGVSDLKITVSGNHATAQFRQSYEAGALAVTSRKTLGLVKSGSGKWLIYQESVGG